MNIIYLISKLINHKIWYKYLLLLYNSKINQDKKNKN